MGNETDQETQEEQLVRIGVMPNTRPTRTKLLRFIEYSGRIMVLCVASLSIWFLLSNYVFGNPFGIPTSVYLWFLGGGASIGLAGGLYDLCVQNMYSVEARDLVDDPILFEEVAALRRSESSKVNGKVVLTSTAVLHVAKNSEGRFLHLTVPIRQIDRLKLRRQIFLPFKLFTLETIDGRVIHGQFINMRTCCLD